MFGCLFEFGARLPLCVFFPPKNIAQARARIDVARFAKQYAL